MDAFVEFLPLLFLLVYYLLGRKRKQLSRQRNQQAQQTGETKGPSPFEEFVRQMEEAMREASGEPVEEKETVIPRPEPPTAPVPPPMPVPTKRPVTALGARPESEFHDIGSFRAESVFESSRPPAHEIHGYGLDQPFSEERFERMARGQDVTEHLHPPLAPTHPRRQPTGAARWRKRLKDPKQAQDALVLTEIFSGPWSPRRPRR